MSDTSHYKSFYMLSKFGASALTTWVTTWGTMAWLSVENSGISQPTALTVAVGTVFGIGSKYLFRFATRGPRSYDEAAAAFDRAEEKGVRHFTLSAVKSGVAHSLAQDFVTTTLGYPFLVAAAATDMVGYVLKPLTDSLGATKALICCEYDEYREAMAQKPRWNFLNSARALLWHHGLIIPSKKNMDAIRFNATLCRTPKRHPATLAWD